ncbi:MAG: hypothetical protein U9O54_00030 [Chloroflexota bacterium]|nr:hypothetical protein [Chloroflexota bacterium]
MLTAIEATIDKKGHVQLQAPIHLTRTKRALVVILEDETTAPISETALLSEAALAKDWNRPEEDEAWAHLQNEPLS